MMTIKILFIYIFVTISVYSTEAKSVGENLVGQGNSTQQVLSTESNSTVSKDAAHPDPCTKSRCGPNSICQTIKNETTCSCLPGFIGSPPNCSYECMISSDCPEKSACFNGKCLDPCDGTCGMNTECQVIKHNPICSCQPGYTGDPFTRCTSLSSHPDPCTRSPCGPNSVCQTIKNETTCSCLPGFIGSPPNCRYECIISSDCPDKSACINGKCLDPCEGVCGEGALCQVINHNPVCSCQPGHTGDPFIHCAPLLFDPCYPNPCGPNAACRSLQDSAVCSCLPGNTGVPPRCRPGCEIDADCPSNTKCINEECRKSCGNHCAPNAICHGDEQVCSCPPGYGGNPFVHCIPEPLLPGSVKSQSEHNRYPSITYITHIHNTYVIPPQGSVPQDAVPSPYANHFPPRHPFLID